MGVHGLWQLLSSTGKPVSLDSLEGKVLAVDVSVWLHQLSKGMRDSDGNPLPHAHLHGLFTRICKLLYYRIKPVFVFDGGVPVLKKQTLAGRREKRDDAEKESTRLQQKLLTNLIRSQAVKEALGLDKAPKLPSVPKKPSRDAVFELPPLTESSERYLKENKDLDESFEERRELQQLVEDQYEDLNALDVDSEEFKCLPPDIQHEIIMDMKERRKTYKMSRRTVTALPEDSKDFSKFQMAKLLKHSKLTTRLDDLRKELNTKTAELSKHLGDSIYDKDIWTQRVISSDASHSVLIKGLRDKRKKSREQKETESYPTISEESSNSDELLHDSGTDERANMDFLNPDQLTVIGKAIGQNRSGDIIGQSRSGDMKISKNSLNGNLDDRGTPCESKNRNESEACDVNIKPVYRPVIEIDTDSDSSDEDTEYAAEPVQNTGKFTSEPVCKARGDNNLVRGELTNDVLNLIPKTVYENIDSEVIILDDSDVMGDIQANRDLQLAIEKSIQDQMNLVAESSVNLSKETGQSKKQSSKQKSIFDKQISNRSAFSDDWNNSGEQMDLNTDKESGNDNKDLKGTTRDIFKKQKSNISNFSDESDKTHEDSIREKKDDANKIPLKRRSSELSDGESEPKRKRLEGLAQESQGENGKEEVVTTLSGNDSSESEDDFLEVKFDPDSLKEDELFPASIFEPGPFNSSQGDGNTVAIEISEKISKTESRKQVKQTKINAADTTEVIMINEYSSESSKESHDNKMEDGEQDAVSGIAYKDDSAGLSKLINNEKDSGVGTEAGEVFEGIEANETGEIPDVIETRRSLSSVSSLPDVVESSDADTTHERVVSPESPTVVPDLVKDYQSLDFQTLTGMRDNLATESRALQQERGRQERLATSINDQMHAEAQELLRLFGVPYIVSPTEAEAQCAQLDILKLTQGTITDDSDIWLFGGTNVYRNFFNQQKHVEFYRSNSIQSQMGLTREKLINLALLCGSDYTEGIQGVGPVTAMEILLEFPGEGLEGLLALKSWWESAQKQYVKPKESKLKAKIRELDLSPGFPSMQVVEAYLSPTVDDSAETFSWGTPDTDGLKHYIGIKLGWSSEKVDEHLQPVLKRLQDRQAQRRISSFFQPENYIEPAKMKSKRLQKVVNKLLNPNETQEVTVEQKESENDLETSSQPQKGKRKGNGQVNDADISVQSEKTDKINEKEVIETKNRVKRGRGRGRGRVEGQRGRGQNGQMSRSDKRSKATMKISESSSSGSSSEDSDSDFMYADLDNEVQVIESGLNIAEILGMSGFSDVDIEDNEKMDVDDGVQEEVNEEFKNSVESDESVSDSELFKNEGGFIKEDVKESVKPVRPVKPQRTEIMQDILKQLEDAKSKYFENKTSQEEGSAADTKSKYFENENSQDLKVSDKASNLVTEMNDEIIDTGTDNISDTTSQKTEAELRVIASATTDNAKDNSAVEKLDKIDQIKHNKETVTDAKISLTNLSQRKVDYGKKIENILKENKAATDQRDHNPSTEVQKEIKATDMKSPNSDSRSNRETYVKSDGIDLSKGEHHQPSENDKVDKGEKTEINEETVKVKTEVSDTYRGTTVTSDQTVQVKTEIGDTYTSDPIKQLVTGVPWAGKKRKTKGGGKGKTRLKGRKIEPVEKIVRKSTRSTKGSKSAVGVINLSESDTDSSD